MKKKNAYNEAVGGDAGFETGEGYPSCEGSPCANVADETGGATDTLTDDRTAAEAAADEQAANDENSATDGAQAAAVADAEVLVAEWKDKYLRLQAEFDNYRKRTLKEKMELVETGGRDVLLEILPVRDDVQRAVAAMEKSDDVEALRGGVQLISQKFTDALRRRGVTEIECLDKAFDEAECEAVARFAAGDGKQGKVIDVIQTGYKLGERVLRFAKVVVGE